MLYFVSDKHFVSEKHFVTEEHFVSEGAHLIPVQIEFLVVFSREQRDQDMSNCC